MAELGFSFDDIRIVLGSHAHADHVEADALIQELTGAEVMAARGDVPALREIRPGGKEHPIDRILDDGDEVTLGGTTLTAHVMPGHTKGCTSWGMELTEDGQSYQALIVCSLNGGFLQLYDNPEYPEIADDFVATFEKARALPVDVFLSSHGVFYGLDAKYEQLLARGPGDPNPFVDPEGYQAHIDEYEEIFETRLEEAAKRCRDNRPVRSSVLDPARDRHSIRTFRNDHPGFGIAPTFSTEWFAVIENGGTGRAAILSLGC